MKNEQGGECTRKSNQQRGSLQKQMQAKENQRKDLEEETSLIFERATRPERLQSGYEDVERDMNLKG